MTRRKRFLRVYSQADWFAHLLVSTCIVAALNFLDVISIMVERVVAAAEAARHGFIVCYFGPPTPFYPRFFVLIGLLIAAACSFKKTAGSRLAATIGLAVALALYIFWWADSYVRFRNYEQHASILALIHPEVEQFACLYQGTPADLAVALSTAVCLTLLLDRLFDGEKEVRSGE